MQERRLSNANWAGWARTIAYPAKPIENSPAAMERLMKYLLPYIEDIKGVRPQFHPRNSVQLTGFQSEWAKNYYYNAEERFIEKSIKLNKLKGEGKSVGIMALVILNEYRQAAEYAKVESQVEAGVDAVMNHGQACVIATNYQKTIARGVQLLHTKYKIPRSKVSLIWGGSSQFTQTERLSQEDIASIVMRVSRGDVIENSLMRKLVNQVKNDDSGLDTSLFPELNLGMQSRKARQLEIDRFQSGKSLFCFYTFKSGGVGLSLHHTDEMTKEKARRKESGYIVEEDIPLIPTRPRITFLSPTYSAIELVQGLGRVPRLTSFSDTPQIILFYAGTVEEKVAAIVSIKLKCLKKVVRQREHWEDAIFEAATAGRGDLNSAIKMLSDSDYKDDEDNGDSPEDLYIDESQEEE